MFRRLWIIRISAACRFHGLLYSRFIHALQKAGVELDRKVLSDMAIQDPGGFAKLLDTAKVLFEHSRESLAPYKRIRRLEFGELPKTVSGKIRRIELREATAAGSDAEYREEDFR